MAILYPPVFYQSFMPAFTDVCRIYFGLSPYNNINDIKEVQVTARNQATNLNVLMPSNGILTKPIGIDIDRQGQDKYYITLSSQDTKIKKNAATNQNYNVNFKINNYYKIQLRFVSSSNNENEISEWSKAILIRRIVQPQFNLKDFEENIVKNFTFKDITVSGKIKFNNDSEALKSYRIKLYKINEDILLEDSNDIYLNSYETNSYEIFYRFKYDFDTNVRYFFEIQIITEDLYIAKKRYHFSIDEVLIQPPDIMISTILDEESGRIGIHLQKNTFQVVATNYRIRRSSNQSNFKIWDELFLYTSPPGENIDYIWWDTTVESGVYYQYGVQQDLSDGYKTDLLKINIPVMVLFKNILLTTKDNQLKLKFDPQLSNIAYNISENKIQTIGSQYPFLIRNGKLKYRTFSISGTITYLMDIRENLMHASRKELLGQQKNLYDNYNEKNNISHYNDDYYERLFREKVVSFLYENDIKILRTIEWGNLLVKLTDISLSSKQNLKGFLYTFSCTAIEIDSFNLKNLEKYNLINKGQFKKYNNLTKRVLLQVFRPNYDLYNGTLDTHEKRFASKSPNRIESFFITGSKNNNWLKSSDITSLLYRYQSDEYNVNIKSLKSLRIEFSNSAYAISKDKEIKTDPQNINNMLAIGHLVRINNEWIIVGKEGILELSGDNVNITNILFKPKTSKDNYSLEQGSILFEAQIEYIPINMNIPKSYDSYTTIGQFWGSYDYNINFVDQIYFKYSNWLNKTQKDADSIIYTAQLQEDRIVDRILGMRIYAKPGTIVQVKENQDVSYNQHIIGESQLLQFFEESTNIKGFRLKGVLLKEADNPNNIKDNEFIDLTSDFSNLTSFSQIERPKRHGVYNISGENYIFYNQNWIQFPNSHIITPDKIDVVIDYYCRVLKRYY